VVVLPFIVLTLDQPRVLFGLFVAYALSGYVMWLMEKLSGRKPKLPPPETKPPHA
jgi:CDP-diacylglycerol--serine O-phosphatidyltransferase